MLRGAISNTVSLSGHWNLCGELMMVIVMVMVMVISYSLNKYQVHNSLSYQLSFLKAGC